MKHAYHHALLALALSFLCAPSAVQAQPRWRPFRPGVIYSYNLGNPATETHTLRVDSAYRSPRGDSVYAFNRLMRQVAPIVGGRPTYVKSRNNLFGARLAWTPGQPSYTVEAEAQAGVQTAASLRLYPQAAAGQTWVASPAPLLTALVQSRSRQTILPGVQDSVATIELRSGTATTGPPLMTFVLSRSHGLLAGPAWLGGAAAGTPGAAPLLAAEPVPLAQSAYNPAALFTMQPGDELGYYWTPFNYLGSVICAESHTLRRVLTRQQRADSLLITYQEQSRYRNTGFSTCGNQASVSVSPTRVGRLVFSMATGRSPQYPAMGLLANEYVRDAVFTVRQGQLMGLGIKDKGGSDCLSSGDQLRYTRVYENPASGPVTTYSPGLDLFAWLQVFGPNPGMGDVQTDQTALVYYRRSVGSPLVCGSFSNFATLLPARAAQAAVAALYPNPAADVATLAFAKPAGPGSTLLLTDGLGRVVWRAPVSAGQTSAVVPLAGRAAGLYWLHLSGRESPATWKLNHE